MQNHKERRMLAKQFGHLKTKNKMGYKTWCEQLQRSIKAGKDVDKIQREAQEKMRRDEFEKKEEVMINFRVNVLKMDPDAAAEEAISTNDRNMQFDIARKKELRKRKSRRKEMA